MSSSSIVISFDRLLSNSNGDTPVRLTIVENHTRHIIDALTQTHTYTREQGTVYYITRHTASISTKTARETLWRERESRGIDNAVIIVLRASLPSSLFGRLSSRHTRSLLYYRRLIATHHNTRPTSSYVTPKIILRGNATRSFCST